MVGEEQSAEKVTRGKPLDTDLPNTTTNNIKIIIQAFFQLNASEVTVKTADVAKVVGLHRDTVSKQLRFLIGTEILVKLGRSYKLSEKGAFYAKLISWEQIEESNKLLGELLQNSAEINQFLTWIKLKKDFIPRNEAQKRFGVISGIPSHRSDLKTGIDSIIQLLVESNLLAENPEGLIKFNQPSFAEEESDETLPLELADDYQTLAERMRVSRSKSEDLTYEEGIGELNLIVNLSIEKDMDPDWIRRVVRAVKLGWKGENDELSDSE